MNFLIYLMIGIGWIWGYDLAQQQYPTKIVNSSQDAYVLKVLTWPVDASAEFSRFLHSINVNSYVEK